MVQVSGSGSIRVVIHDSRIAELSLPGGDVYRFTSKLAKQTQAMARGICPVGGPTAGYPPGYLYGKHYRRVIGLPKGCVGYVGNSAPHALWVHEGTTGPIYPTRGQWLRVPSLRRTGRLRYTYRRSVAGQSAQPWLENAMVAVISANRL